jgi:hypothetical protein
VSGHIIGTANMVGLTKQKPGITLVALE